MHDNVTVLALQALVGLVTVLTIVVRGRSGVRDARAEAKQQIAEAVLVATSAVESVKAPSDDIEEYRREVVRELYARFESWKRD